MSSVALAKSKMNRLIFEDACNKHLFCRPFQAWSEAGIYATFAKVILVNKPAERGCDSVLPTTLR